MTEATSGRSWLVSASACTIEAIVSTSNGVRCLLRAYDMLTVANSLRKVRSWSATSALMLIGSLSW